MQSPCKNHAETIQQQYRNHAKHNAETMQKHTKHHAETMQKQFRNHTETIQQTYRNQTNTIQKQCRNDAETMQKPFRNHAKSMQTPFRNHTELMETIQKQCKSTANLLLFFQHVVVYPRTPQTPGRCTPSQFVTTHWKLNISTCSELVGTAHPTSLCPPPQHTFCHFTMS